MFPTKLYETTSIIYVKRFLSNCCQNFPSKAKKGS